MDANRVVNIVLTDISLDSIKAQEELERTINSDIHIDEKAELIKLGLKTLVLSELMITKLQTLVSTNNKNENTPKQNG